MAGTVVVTGGAGFIGSAMVGWLNRRGRERVLVVDENMDEPLKKRNLDGKKVLDALDKDAFLEEMDGGRLPADLEAIVHMGACSSTMETDEAYLEKNNVAYSKALCRWALNKGVRFIYASSAATYGDGNEGYEDDPRGFDHLKPLNAYGRSKWRFDLWVRDQGLLDQVVGFKFFNVYGPNEQHKGEMRSLVCKAHAQILDTGRLKLFKSYRPDYKDGEQVRDFIYVKDVLDVMGYALENKGLNGIFNLGTGRARTWKDLANSVFAAMGREPAIDFVDMPEEIRDKYQYHTQADMRRLFKAAKPFEFMALEDAVADYVKNYLALDKNY